MAEMAKLCLQKLIGEICLSIKYQLKIKPLAKDLKRNYCGLTA